MWHILVAHGFPFEPVFLEELLRRNRELEEQKAKTCVWPGIGTRDVSVSHRSSVSLWDFFWLGWPSPISNIFFRHFLSGMI